MDVPGGAWIVYSSDVHSDIMNDIYAQSQERDCHKIVWMPLCTL
jgi:hypothetical protein